MSRFIDGVDVFFDDADWTPNSPSQLLAKLGVRGQSKARQQEAIASWLKSNDPSPFLRTCLVDDGLLDSVDSRRHSAA